MVYGGSAPIKSWWICIEKQIPQKSEKGRWLGHVERMQEERTLKQVFKNTSSSSLSIPIDLQLWVLGPFPKSNSISSSLFNSTNVFPFLLAASITHSPSKSSLVFLYPFFSPFWPPLPVLVLYNPAFLPRVRTTVYFFYLYNLGLVPDLMFL